MKVPSGNSYTEIEGEKNMMAEEMIPEEEERFFNEFIQEESDELAMK